MISEELGVRCLLSYTELVLQIRSGYLPKCEELDSRQLCYFSAKFPSCSAQYIVKNDMGTKVHCLPVIASVQRDVLLYYSLLSSEPYLIHLE